MYELLLSLLAALLIADAPTSEARCSYAHVWFPVRGESTDFYVARATGDSVFVRDVYSGIGGLFTTPQYSGQEKISVYGQIAEVVQPAYDAAPGTAAGEKVVLIWWSYGASCEIIPTRRALVATPGTEVFVNLSPLPRPSWIDGLKSYDVEGQLRGTLSLYAPQFVNSATHQQTDTVRPEAMTAAEFMTMYRMLMPAGTSAWNAMQHFLRWARDNPLLAAKYPACLLVEVSEANLLPGEQRSSKRCS